MLAFLYEYRLSIDHTHLSLMKEAYFQTQRMNLSRVTGGGCCVVGGFESSRPRLKSWLAVHMIFYDVIYAINRKDFAD